MFPIYRWNMICPLWLVLMSVLGKIKPPTQNISLYLVSKAVSVLYLQLYIVM